MKIKDIVNVIEHYSKTRERLSELYHGYHLASTKEEHERCLNDYNKLKEEYEQWLESEVKING